MLYIALKHNLDNDNLNEFLINNELDNKKDDKNLESDYLVIWDWEKDLSIKLKSLNKDWYNIYVTLNDFWNNRRTKKNIIWVNKILIDYDSNDRISLFDNLLLIKEKFWIYPIFINKTYKWFHCVYWLNEDIYNMNIDQYEELSKQLVRLTWWDIKALQLTWIYKVPWYIDNKDNRNFEIKVEENNYWKFLINKEIAKKIIKQKISIKLAQYLKYDKLNNKKESSKVFYETLLNIPFKEVLISKLKNIWINIEINENNNLIINSKPEVNSWIKWCKDWDYIYDFSHWKRTWENRANWNYNFLFKYIFKEDYIKFITFCSNQLWLKKVWVDKIQIPKTLVKAFNSNSKDNELNIFVDSNNDNQWNEVLQLLEKKAKKDIVDLINLLKNAEWFEIDWKHRVKDDLVKINPIQQVIYWIYAYIKERKIEKNESNEYWINVNDFIEYIWLSSQNKTRVTLFELLLKISCLTISKKSFRKIDGKERIAYEFIRPIDLKWFVPETNKDWMLILLNIMQTDDLWYIYTNQNILKINTNPLTTKNNKTRVAFIILDQLDQMKQSFRNEPHKWVKWFTVNSLKLSLGIDFSREDKNIKYINEFLLDLKEKKIIWNFRYLKEKNVFEILDNNFEKNSI